MQQMGGMGGMGGGEMPDFAGMGGDSTAAAEGEDDSDDDDGRNVAAGWMRTMLAHRTSPPQISLIWNKQHDSTCMPKRLSH